MTAEIPPTAGPTSSQERLAAVDVSNPMDIQQEQDGSIPGEFDAAMSQGEAWNNSIGELWHSGAGYGSGGFEITAPEAADDWPTGMMFPHQGP